MTTKSEAYWEGYRKEAARIAVRDANREAMDSRSISDIAAEVAKNLGRDNAKKQRIWQRSPHVFSAMDAEALGQASSRELATRELKELGIDCGDNDPVAMLDAHHAGRHYARDQQIPGNRLAGGNRAAIPGQKLLGEGMDGAPNRVQSYIDKLLEE